MTWRRGFAFFDILKKLALKRMGGNNFWPSLGGVFLFVKIAKFVIFRVFERVVGKLNFLRYFFSCRSMVKKEMIVGELPQSRSLYKRAISMAWPSTLESVLVGLIGAVDTMMVGSLGHEAISAVGITVQPRFIFLAFVLSLNVGVTAVTARRKGQNDRAGANGCLKQALLLSGGLSLLLSIGAIIFAEPILRFAGAGDDIISDALDYFRILMVGLFFNSVALTINAAQRGVGKTKISMINNVTANVINIIFNFLLITGQFGFPRLGVKGAAIATVLGFFVAFVMAICSIIKKENFLSVRFRGGWKFEGRTMRGLADVGSSALVEQLCLRFGFFTYAKIVASLGTMAFAAHQICNNISTISFCFGDGIAVAASALVGQSLGEKRPDLSIIYGKISQRIAMCVSACLTLAFIFGRTFFISLFSDEAPVIELGAQVMLVLAAISLPQTSQVVISGCLRGAGDTKFVAGVSLVSTAIVRPIIAWLLCYPLNLGLVGAWVSMLIDQVGRLACNFARFSTGKWTKKEV